MLKAQNFYTETLGFTVVRDLAANEQRWVELAPHGKVPTITLVTRLSKQSLGYPIENLLLSGLLPRLPGALHPLAAHEVGPLVMVAIRKDWVSTPYITYQYT